MVTLRYDLNMSPCGDPVKIHLPQGETDFEIHFNLYSTPGELALSDASNWSAKLTGKYPSGGKHSYSLYLTYQITGGVVSSVDIYLSRIDKTQAMALTAEKGVGVYNIEITNRSTNKKLYSPLIFITVD